MTVTMKKLFYLLVVAMCATMFTACSKDDENDTNFDDWEINLQLNIEDNSTNVCQLFFEESDKYIINWGDGVVETYTEHSKPHHYYTQGTYHVNIKGRGQLKVFVCNNNPITLLDIGKCQYLTMLQCISGQLTSLNVSNCRNLEKLFCNHNNLVNLSVENCTVLKELRCNNNSLVSLNLEGCISLTSLDCEFNQFTEDTMNEIYTILPDRTTTKGSISISNPIGDKSIAEAKGWEIYKKWIK